MIDSAQRQVHVLGAAGIDEQTLSSRRDRVVLAAIVLERGRSVSVDTLTEALWPDRAAPASAAKVTHGCINRLRAQLGPDAIETTPAGYRLREGEVTVDAAAFERNVRR